MSRPLRVTEGGHLLWRDHLDAVRFAHFRCLRYGTRQHVTGELVLGVWFWRVVKARERVAEPCS